MIWFVYYSKGRCTARFVHNQLLAHPELRLKSRARRLFARSPHGPQQGHNDSRDPIAIPTEPFEDEELPIRGKDTVVVCIPTYGRFDMKVGRSTDFVPRCLRPWIERADAVILFGNRNFGADYCAAEREVPPGVPILAKVELSGDTLSAQEVVGNLEELLYQKKIHNEVLS